MTYDCGKCGRANDIKPREPVRCLECGYRIVFKQRTKKMVHGYMQLIRRLEWVGSDGSGNGDTTYETGNDDCWTVIHGSDNLNWNQFDAHKIGWIISGVFALAATIISAVHIAAHLKNYTKPRQQ
ncbi:DNA-directed RNA polymerase core subunit rpc10, partial [Coemansia sp. RSA 1939]